MEQADAAALRDHVDDVVDVTGTVGSSAAGLVTVTAPPVSLSAPDFALLHRLLHQLFVMPYRPASTAVGPAEKLQKFLDGETRRAGDDEACRTYF